MYSPYVDPRTQVPLEVGGGPIAEFQEHLMVAGFWSKRGTLSGSLIWVTAADTWCSLTGKGV